VISTRDFARSPDRQARAMPKRVTDENSAAAANQLKLGEESDAADDDAIREMIAASKRVSCVAALI
jgi:hypothetical protein